MYGVTKVYLVVLLGFKRSLNHHTPEICWMSPFTQAYTQYFSWTVTFSAAMKASLSVPKWTNKKPRKENENDSLIFGAMQTATDVCVGVKTDYICQCLCQKYLFFA